MGIDDPVAWFNAVPEAVLDSWLAYYSIEAEEEAGKTKKLMDPMEAYKRLQEKFG